MPHPVAVLFFLEVYPFLAKLISSGRGLLSPKPSETGPFFFLSGGGFSSYTYI